MVGIDKQFASYSDDSGFCPSLFTFRQYQFDGRVFLVFVAAHAHWHKIDLTCELPFMILLEMILPALFSSLGDKPAQLVRLPEPFRNRVMSTPISAIM